MAITFVINTILLTTIQNAHVKSSSVKEVGHHNLFLFPLLLLLLYHFHLLLISVVEAEPQVKITQKESLCIRISLHCNFLPEFPPFTRDGYLV